MAGPANKYNFSGIGAASAKLVMAALVANGQAWAAGGFLASVVSWFLTQAFSMAASVGLVLLNLGAERIEGILDAHAYDGTWDSAEKLVDAARAAHQALTPQQIKSIDDPVIAALRRFAVLADANKPDINQ